MQWAGSDITSWTTVVNIHADRPGKQAEINERGFVGCGILDVRALNLVGKI